MAFFVFVFLHFLSFLCFLTSSQWFYFSEIVSCIWVALTVVCSVILLITLCYCSACSLYLWVFHLCCYCLKVCLCAHTAFVSLLRSSSLSSPLSQLVTSHIHQYIHVTCIHACSMFVFNTNMVSHPHVLVFFKHVC